MARTDQYRPTEIDPAAFDWIDAIDTQPPAFMGYGGVDDPHVMNRMHAEYNAMLERHLGMIRKIESNIDPDADHRSVTRCGHCGAYLRYAFLYSHKKTGRTLVVGEDCAQNTMDVPDRATLDMKRLRERARAVRMREAENRAAMERREKAESEYPEAVEIMRRIISEMAPADQEIYLGKDTPRYVLDDLPFLQNVSVKFMRNGYLSKKQAEAIVRVYRETKERQVRRLQQELERQQKIERGEIEPCPTGNKITIEGEVIKTEWKENQYGSRKVMTVADDRGFKVWGTVPSPILGVERGDRVRFIADLEAKDEGFGFYRKPRKSEIVEEGE